MAKKELWIFSNNFIANAVRDNYLLALVIAKYHLDALIANMADADILARKVIFEVLYDTLVKADITKTKTKDSGTGFTASLKVLFKQIVDIHLPLWQNKIAQVYPVKTSKYKSFFPNGNKPFESGRIESKIKAVEVLAAATLADPALAAVSALISAFLVDLNATRNDQLTAQSTFKGLISTQQKAIDEMCDAHFIDHGLAITKYSKNPKKIASFTDVQNLQYHQHDTTYMGTVNGEKTKTAFVHKSTAATTFSVSSNVDVQVWVINKADNVIKPTGVKVLAGVPTVVGFPALGNVNNRVFQIKNLTTDKGIYSITIS